jgi:WD40 repeat protein
LGPAGYVYSVAFSPDGKILADGATDGTVWLWDFNDRHRPALLATLTGPTGQVFSVAFSPSGRTLVAGSADGTVRLWDTSPPTAEQAICATIGQSLTRNEWATSIPGLPYHPPCTDN